MAGNALGRLFFKLAAEGEMPSDDTHYQPLPTGGGQATQLDSRYWVNSPSTHMNTPVGMAGNVAGAIDPELGTAVTALGQVMNMMNLAPAWATQYIQAAPGPRADIAKKIQQQTGVISMTAASSMGSELRNALNGRGKGPASTLIQSLLKLVPGKGGQEIVARLQEFAKPTGDKLSDDKASLVLGMVAGQLVQASPAVGQIFGQFFPNVITDARPLMSAYTAARGGKFDPAGFEGFVADFQKHVNHGTFAQRDAEGNVIPGSMNAQTASQLAAYAAENAPTGSSPGQIFAATANVSKALNSVMNIVGEATNEAIDVNTAMALIKASPNAPQIISNPNAALGFVKQYAEVAKAAGMPIQGVVAHADAARKAGYNPVLAIQALAQHALAKDQLDRDPTMRALPVALRERIGAGLGQASTQGVHESDNLKMLAAASDLNAGFADRLQKAFASGDQAGVAQLIRQAKAMPNAWARYKTTDTSYVENMMAEGGPEATKAFLAGEIADVTRRAMTPRLANMPTAEILKRLSGKGGTTGLNNREAALFRRPEFISSLLYSRGVFNTKPGAQAPVKNNLPSIEAPAYVDEVPAQKPAEVAPVAQAPQAPQAPTPTAALPTPKPAVTVPPKPAPVVAPVQPLKP